MAIADNASMFFTYPTFIFGYKYRKEIVDIFYKEECTMEQIYEVLKCFTPSDIRYFVPVPKMDEGLWGRINGAVMRIKKERIREFSSASNEQRIEILKNFSIRDKLEICRDMDEYYGSFAFKGLQKLINQSIKRDCNILRKQGRKIDYSVKEGKVHVPFVCVGWVCHTYKEYDESHPVRKQNELVDIVVHKSLDTKEPEMLSDDCGLYCQTSILKKIRKYS
jgi:hypothetical protein